MTLIRRRNGIRGRATVGVQLVAVLLSLTFLRSSASAAPADITTSPAPVMGAPGPARTTVESGDAKVSPQTGSLGYGYPISLPPGRGGAKPSISLQYSSQGALYGGIAAGWTLGGVPEIRRDYSEGFESFDRPYHNNTGVSVKPRWVSTMSGGRELVEIPGEDKPFDMAASYRAQADSSFTRYQRLTPEAGTTYSWAALTTDGSRYEFGFGGLNNGDFPDWAPLTRYQDQFGNQVHYNWEPVHEYVGNVAHVVDRRLSSIEYSENLNAGVDHHAKVTFTYDKDEQLFACNGQPVGAVLRTHNDKRRWQGISKLVGITSWVRDTRTSPWRIVRTYELAYNKAAADCDPGPQHTPNRLLETITERDGNGTVLRPATTFGYGSMIRTMTGTLSVGNHSSISNPDELYGWGNRVTHGPVISSTLEAQLLDVNADGRPDRLFENASTGDARCMINWNKNTAGSVGNVYYDAYFNEGAISTPSGVPPIPWKNYDPNNTVDTGTMGADENCSLTGQHSMIVNLKPDQQDPVCHRAPLGHYNFYRFLDINNDRVPDLVTALHYDRGYYEPPKPPSPPSNLAGSACPVLDKKCVSRAIRCIDGECMYHHAALTQCIADAPTEPCFDTAVENEPIFMVNGNDGPFPEGAIDFYEVGLPIPPDHKCVPARQPVETGGVYHWRWYQGRGDGTFDVDNGQNIFAPIPLASHTGDPAPKNSLFSTSNQTNSIIDLDGDGYLDAVHINNAKNSPTAGSAIWWYWRGNGKGEFLGRDHDGNPSTKPIAYHWTVPTGARPFSLGSLIDTGDVTSRQKSGMIDVNADGRPDYVTFHGTDATTLRVHYNIGTGFAQDFHEFTLPHSELSRSVTDKDVAENDIEGYHSSVLRSIDFDADGRPDWNHTKNGVARMYWNHLGGLSGANNMNVASDLSERTKVGPSKAMNRWSLARSTIDLNGDGVIDIAEAGSSSATTELVTGDRRAVLKSIDNNRGMVTTFAYAPHTDARVVNGADGKLPSPTWVVSTMTRTDAYNDTGADVEQWKYRYNKPVFNADEEKRYGFRGFESVETTSPSGALTVDSFGYEEDKTGRQVGTVVYADASDTDKPHTISRTTWKRRTLFGGTVHSFHAIDTSARTCAAGQSYAACETSGAHLYTATDWQAIEGSAGAGVLYAAVSVTRSASGAVLAAGDRRGSTTHVVHYDETNYRLRTLNSKREEYDGGVWSLTGGADYQHDADGKVVEVTSIWRDADTKVLSRNSYDMATGNLEWRIKPEQYEVVGDAGKKEFYFYDKSFKLFVEQTVNELKHVVETSYDLATGALTSTRGPNAKQGKAEEVRFTLDSQGRPIEKWVTIDGGNNSQHYVDKLVQRITYYDFQLPQLVRTETRVDYDGSAWVTVDRQLDGHGRMSSETTSVDGTPKARNEYDYDTAGKVVTFRTPDPTDDDAMVAYTYTYDSLGRPTGLRNSNGHGANSSWNGLEQTVVECESDGVACVEGGATTAQKRLLKDVFGRLVRVQERTETDWATTTYGYDANDNMSTIVNAEGRTTSLTHNWSGQRVEIQRAGQTWTYTYDLNGNLDSQIMPHADGANPDDYTVTVAYDDLDRVSSRIVRKADLPAGDADGLGVGMIASTYDVGVNGRGRLYRVNHPNHTLQLTYEYDGRGRTASEEVVFNLAAAGQGQLTDTRKNEYTYNAMGNVVRTTYADGTATQSPTSTVVSYDDRGLPMSVSWGATTLATYTRNVAGGVETRTSPNSDRTFGYDRLGRVTDDVAVGSGGDIQFGHAFTYHKTGDVATLTSHVADTAPRNFTFSFDRRHQLKTAVDDHGYSASMGYSIMGKITGAKVAVPKTARAALNRDVIYDYSLSGDKQAPDELTDQATGDSKGRNWYDLRGNVTRRKVPSEGTVDFSYDGDNNMRVGKAIESSESYYYGSAGTRTLGVRRDKNGLVDRVRLWLGGTEVWYTPAGTISKTWAHVSLGSPIARIENGKTVDYSHHSMLGNLIVSLDKDGNATAGYQYGAFGELLESTGDADNHLRRFNGKEHDQLSRLAYYGYRYYDKLFMSWTQSDPLYRFVPDRGVGEPRRMNLYAFTANNPLRYLDPDGREIDTYVVDVVPRLPDSVAGNPAAVDQLTASRSVSGAMEGGGDFDLGKPVVRFMARNVVVPFEAGYAVGTSISEGNTDAIRNYAADKLNPLERAPTKLSKPTPRTGCFVAGTLVRTANGTKVIEAVEVGDLVLSRDERTGLLGYKPVERTFVRHRVAIIDVALAGGDVIQTTAEHPFWVQGTGWVDAGKLRAGQRLWTASGVGLTVTAATVTASVATVYNLTVAGFHTYFVGGAAIWVHNNNCDDVVTANGQTATRNGTRIGPSKKAVYHYSNSATKKKAKDGAQAQGSGGHVTDAATTVQPKHNHAVDSQGRRIRGPRKTHFNKRGDKKRKPKHE